MGMVRVDFDGFVDYIEQLRINRNLTKTEFSALLGKEAGYWSDVTKMSQGTGWRGQRSGRHLVGFYEAVLTALGLAFYIGPAGGAE